MSRPLLLACLLAPAAFAAVPATPTAQSPATWSTDATQTLTASTYSDVDGDPQTAAQLQIRVSTGSYGGAGSFDSGTLGAVRQWTTPALTNGETYAWHARYSDASGWSAWSAELTFRLDIEFPTIPGGVAISGANPAGGFFTMSWTASIDTISGVQRYRISAKEAATSYTFSNPTATSVNLIMGPGSYELRVRAEDVAGNDGTSSAYLAPLVITADPSLAAPTALAGSPAVTNGAISLSWSAVTGATHYVIQRSGDGGLYWRHLKVVTSTSTTDTPSVSGDYLYRVCAASSATSLVGDWSAPLGSALRYDEDVPTTPNGLTVTPSPSSVPTVTFGWNASTDTGTAGISGVASYDAQRAVAGVGAYTTIASAQAATSVNDAPGDGRWLYRARSRDVAGNVSAYAQPASVMIDTTPPTDPGAPIAAVTVTNQPVVLSWVASTDATAGVASYVLERTGDGGASWTTLSSTLTAASYTDPALEGRYRYRVRALDTLGNPSALSPESAEVVVDLTAPGTPAAPLISPEPTGGPVTVSWSAVTDSGGAGLADYLVERSSDGGATWLVAGTVAGTSLDETLTTATWRYRVTARDAAGNVAVSAVSSDVRADTAVARLRFTSAPATVLVGDCVAATFRTENALGASTATAADTPVALGSSGAVTFFSDPGCTTAIAALTVAAGQPGGGFSWRASTYGVVTLTLAASGLGGDSQAQTVKQLSAGVCGVDGDCQTGFCADGVCCDGACAGTCESCALAGSQGQCTPQPALQDPDGECGSGLCGGSCDGARACQYPAVTTGCGECHHCDGAGACAASTDGASCADGSYCNGAEQCVAGACQPGTAVSCTPQGSEVRSCDEATQSCVVQGQAPPVILHDALLTAAVGVEYPYNSRGGITALGTSPLTFSRCGGPLELQVDARTGGISFLPTTAAAVFVCVQADNAYGSDQYAFTLQVDPAPAPAPVAAIAPVAAGPAPLSVGFDGRPSRSGDGAPLAAYRWRLGEGGPLGVGDQHPTVYPLPGGYRARLDVIDRHGQDAAAFAPIEVRDAAGRIPPRARAVASALRGDGALDVTLSCDCVAGSAPLRQWTWRSATQVWEGETVQLSLGPGRHHLLLEVVDANGLSAFDRVELVVTSAGEEPPRCELFADPPSGLAPQAVSYSVALAPGRSQVATLSLDAEGQLTSEPQATVQHAAAGRYLATVAAADASGLGCTDLALVRLANAAGQLLPEFVTRADATATCGRPYRYSLGAALPAVVGTGPFAFRIDGPAPAGLAVDGETGEVRWTPSRADTGTQTFVLRAESPAGSALQTIDVTVSCPDPDALAVGCGCQAGGAPALLLGAALLVRRRRRGAR